MVVLGVAAGLLPGFGFVSKSRAGGASLFFSPNKGEYLVNNTFDVGLLVNTGDQAINAIETTVTFPADLLQVVNPVVSNSFIEFWIAGPTYSNTEGKLTLQGGLPSPGVSTTSGVITTIQFRAKAAGKATLKYESSSKILANDGQGTNILTARAPATFDLKLPPPAGPVVSSSTHEDSNRWYSSRSIRFLWERPAGASDFSYLLDSNPLSSPDEQTDTTETEVTKTVESDGIWFFHIRAKNSASWGGTTHFPVKIDGSPPAGFKIELDRKTFHPKDRPIVKFFTTDAASGLDHYEIKPIDRSADGGTAGIFTEQQSPYQLLQLKEGRYQLVVRAIDRAGNYRDETIDLEVVSPATPLITKRLPAWMIILLGAIGLIVLLVIIFALWRRQEDRGERPPQGTPLLPPASPDPEVVRQLAEDHQSLKDRHRQIQQLIDLRRQTNPAPPSGQSLDPGQGLPGEQAEGGTPAGGNEGDLV